MSKISDHLRWRQSSWCGTNACMEVADDGRSMHVRNSTDPEGPRLGFTHETWSAFISGLKTGQFDEPLTLI